MAAKIIVEVVARFDTAGGLTPLWMVGKTEDNSQVLFG